MRVGLSAYLMHQGVDYRAAGVSTYAVQLLRHLPLTAPEHEYVSFQGSDAPTQAGVETAIAPVATLKPGWRIPWEQAGLPISARRRRIELLHGTVNVIPLLAGMPTVVTVHDLAFLRVPGRFPPMKQRYLALAVRAGTARAAKIIAVSEQTRRDLIELLGVAPEKISTVYSGVDESFQPVDRETSESFRRQAMGNRPYVLHVGTLE
ncbi:MAG: glycosyltransferase, partial [Chloroflexota bacterium]